MKTGIKNIIFGLLIALLLLPLAQQKLQFAPELPLNGAVEYAPKVAFSLATWWDGTYQDGAVKYLSDHVGLRSYLIKTNNQFDFDVFKKLHAKDVVVGKHNYLFEQGYIDAYYGLNYAGDADLRIKLLKLKRIQDTLEHLGKKLLLVHAPSKAWYYPEELPEQTKATPFKTVYQDCIRIEDSLGIRSIDFNAVFMQMKDSTQHLLFSKQGIHWTRYGALLASDSIIKYLAKETGKKLPKLVIDKLITTDSVHIDDIDLARGLNILKPIAKDRFTYPEYHFETDAHTQRLNGIYIGDSFFWCIFSQFIPLNINNDYEFWYYFKSVWYRRAGKEGETTIDNMDWQASIDHTDVLLLLYTDINLPSLGNDFVEKAYEYYYPDAPL